MKDRLERRHALAVDEAAARLGAGGLVALLDAPDRMNQAELVLAAQHVSAEALAFMAREARGVICLYLTGARCDALRLRSMVSRSESRFASAFTVSVEARHGVTTGISASDRARTISVVADPASGPHDVVVPGHVFPLRAREGGVLERPGHTEAAVELARLAGLDPAVVGCGILRDDGEVARGPDLRAWCMRHSVPVLRVADLVEHRLRHGSGLSAA